MTRWGIHQTRRDFSRKSEMTLASQRTALETIRKEANHALALAKELDKPPLVYLLAQVLDTTRSLIDQLDADEVEQVPPGQAKH